MTDWSTLTHAYGTAEDIPALLDRLATEPDDAGWSDLWSALCHQGTTYPASRAALPRLADLAGRPEPVYAAQAVVLAGAIVADGGEEVRVRFGEAVERLSRRADELLPAADDDTYAYLLEATLAFEGAAAWQDTLAWGVSGEEYEVECGECGVDLAISVADGTCAEEGGESTMTRPANAERLEGSERRAHDLATAHGKQQVARVLLHLYGQATCPACGSEFVVAERVGG
ncbi:hypothetical protein GCM10010492_19210 [Saccharothrix mutabilis subsp. mutabilis]|uniref:Uncharacterized protein n=1 Tax=Saccharothrix mutabilis subsp. mutabilis TaxID=66855 RepID=A0ABN0TGK8_9PSEU